MSEKHDSEIERVIEYCESLREILKAAQQERESLRELLQKEMTRSALLREAQRWRKVEEELPEKSIHYEVFLRPPDSKGWFDIAFWDDTKWYMGEKFVFSDPNDYIVYWRHIGPLPKGPEAKGSEG